MELQSTKRGLSFSVTEERLALILLVGQSFFLGYAFALLYTVANTLFLLDYGSPILPYTFVAIAVVVPAFSFAFSGLQKRWPLPRLAFATMAFFTVMFFLVRAGLELPGARWLSFALLVCFTLGSLLCGIVRGAQAGFLFDARTLKQVYPLIVGGEIMGVIAGGISSTFLPRLLGSTENVLLVCGASMFLLVVLLAVSNARFRGVLSESRSRERPSQARASLPRLFGNRYVVLVLVYQILSAMGTRLVYYLFLTQAEATFRTPEALTSFFGVAMAAVTVVTLLFVVLASGRLLTRYGMGLGLAGNPVGVGVAVAAAAVVGSLFGSGVPLFFWLVLCAGLFDMVLTSGLTDTTVQSAYQPLPPAERTAVRTLVEGVGIPVAYGVSGLCLLAFGWIRQLGLVHVVYLTLFVAAVWTAASLVLYRSYGDRLRQSVRRRWLDQGISLGDRSSLRVLESLLRSPEAREVILALELLEKAEHPSLPGRLLEVLRHPEPEVRAAALAAIERVGLSEALPGVQGLLSAEPCPPVRAAAVRALCALSGDDLEQALPYLEDPEPEVRKAALVGLFRYGSIGGVVAAMERFAEMGASPDPAPKIALARVVGEIGARSLYQPLLPLLADGSAEVRREALLAAANVSHPRLLAPVIANLKSAATRSAAMSALAAAGDALVPLIDEALDGQAPDRVPDGGHDKDTLLRLIRCCSRSGGDGATAAFARRITHPDEDIQLEILKGLANRGYRAAGEQRSAVEGLLRDQLRRALRALLATQDLGESREYELLRSALEDELALRRRRIFLLLSFLYDPQAVMGAERKLASGIKTQAALALELLDVTLEKDIKRCLFPLLDENVPLKRRVEELKGLVGLDNLSARDRLRELITDTAAWPSGWTRACAVHAAAAAGISELAPEVEAALGFPEPPVRETAAWALHRLDPAAWRRHAPELRDDPQLCGLARQLEA